MPIRVRCTDCEEEYNLLDTLAGKKIRCKKCQTLLAVPNGSDDGVTEPAPKKKDGSKAKVRAAAVRDGDDEPRQKRRRDEDDDDDPRPRKRKKKLPMGWIIGGSAAALLVVGGIVAAVLLSGGPTLRGEPEIKELIKLTKEAKAGKTPEKQLEASMKALAIMLTLEQMKLTEDEQEKLKAKYKTQLTELGIGMDELWAAQNAAKKKVEQQKNPKNDGNLVKPSGTPSDKKDDKKGPEGRTPDPIGKWNITINPPPTYELPADLKGSITVGAGRSVLFPSVSSPYILVTQKDPKTNAFLKRVYDIRTFEPFGVAINETSMQSPLALSADGTLFAVTDVTTGNLNVWSMVKGERIAKDLRDPSGKGGYHFVDFLPGGQVLLGQSGGQAATFQILDSQTGETRTFAQNVYGLPNEIALSPDGRYLAGRRLSGARQFVLIDVATGAVAAELSAPGFPDRCWGIAFSPDGQFLAALIAIGPLEKTVYCWNMKSGACVFARQIPAPVDRNSTSQTRGHLQWLHDNSGWLICEEVLMDAKEGRQIGKLPQIPRNMDGRRRIVRDGYFIDVKNGPMLGATLSIQKLPRN